jgi:hypothetical protein
LRSTSEFITHLIRVANTIERHTELEQKRLLDSALFIIRIMHDNLPAFQVLTREAILELQAISAAVAMGLASDAQVKKALLEAAGLIREFKLAVDAPEA